MMVRLWRQPSALIEVGELSLNSKIHVPQLIIME